MFLLFKTNLCFAVTLALCVSWNLGSHSRSRYQPIIRNKCRDTCFQLCNPEVFKNWVNNIKLFQILWRKNHDHTYVLNVKCISSPTICGIESTDGTKYDCIDRFGLQVMKICWGDNKSKLHINYHLYCHVTLQTFLLSDTDLHPTPISWNWYPERLCSVRYWLLPWKWDWSVKRSAHAWELFLQKCRFTSALQGGP